MSNAVWDITSKCNLRCKHCYNADKYFASNFCDLSYSDALRVLDFLVANNCKDLSLLGGEPLCHPYIYQILKRCRQKKINVSITSNGTLLNEHIVDFIINETSVQNLLISLDGPTSNTNDNIRGFGSFNIIKKNLKLLLQHNDKLRIGISCCICAVNCQELYRMIDVCKELGIVNLLITPLINSGNASINIDVLQDDTFMLLDCIEKMAAYASKVYPHIILQIDVRPLVVWYLNKKYPVKIRYSLKHTKCQVLDGLLYIQANGELHPCGFHNFQAGIEAQHKGYFNSKDTFRFDKYDTVGEIYKSKYYVDFLNAMKQLKKDTPHFFCKNCPTKSDCYPCPFQFSNGVIECDWVTGKIQNINNELKKIIIVEVKNVTKDYLTADERLILDVCNVGNDLKMIYQKYVNVSSMKKRLSFFSFVEILNQMERKFIVKTRRSYNV